MKKSIIVLFCILLMAVGCKPVNPPQSDDDVVRIINILYNGMGKTADVCVKPLTEMGFELPYCQYNGKAGYYDGYYIKTDKYEISIACQHDYVTLARYAYSFRNTYVNGVKEFHKADDVVYNFGWERWRGGYNTEFTDLSLHNAANAEIDSCVAANKSSHCFVLSTYEKSYADKYLLVNIHYWAVSAGGMNPDTGDALGSMADSDVSIEFMMNAESNSAFIYDHIQ